MQTKDTVEAEKRLAQGFDWKTAVAVAITVLTWASAFAGIRVGLQAYSPESVALLRYLVAAVALAGYALLTKMSMPRRQDLLAIAALGFVGFTFYNVTLNAGEQQIPAGTASMLIASAPVFVALLALAFLHERLCLRAWLGIGLSFLGVAVISVGSGAGGGISWSALLVLAAAFSGAIYSVGQKPYLRRYGALQFTTYAVWFGTLFLLWFLPGLVQEMSTAAPAATWAVIYMGIFPGAIGYVSWSYVLSRLPASQAGSFLYLIPATAIFIAWLWLGEIPAAAAWFGGALILLGVLLVNVRRSK